MAMSLHPARWPLSVRVLLALLLGMILGVAGGSEPYLRGLGNADLGQIGLLIIRLLKALAIPLILFGILDAFVRHPISARSGRRLICICLFNVTVALALGLSLMRLLQPGLAWRGHLDELMTRISAPPTAPASSLPKTSLEPLQSLGSLVPQSLLDPILNGNVIGVVLLALLFGAAIARLRRQPGNGDLIDLTPLTGSISAFYAVLSQVLGWLVQFIPLAVLGLVAQAVGKAGLGIFADLAGYFGVIALGLILHGLVYYPLMAWLVARQPPRAYLGHGADAILTGLSTNSSLATVPVTLRCLKRLGVGDRSARLAACAGTNFNNDGVTLYEVMTALFLMQALGSDLQFGQELQVALAALLAGMGIAGVPEAGLIVLPLVLSAAGLPETVVAAAIPLIAPVDWLLARLRSAVNVLSDMLVAILLDAWEKRYPND